MNRRFLLFGLVFFVLLGIFYFFNSSKDQLNEINTSDEMKGGLISDDHPLSITSLRSGDYPGSEFVFEQTLTPGSNYQRYIVSYKSEGLKIYALLTIPNGEVPRNGFPAIVFNHGYIPPAEYRTTEKYIAYTDEFSRNGYVLIRPDYGGHGESEGQATGGYSSNDYTIDVLNAFASLKNLKDPSSNLGQIIDVENIGFWGHSMGGYITLRAMVARNDIKAGVIWAGVVASHEDLFNRWRRRGDTTPSPGISVTPSTRGGRWRQSLEDKYGSPEENSVFWSSLSANSYLKDISGPVQLHHGTDDDSVPVEFSQELENQLKDVGKEVEYYEYEGDDHNISVNFSLAAKRSVEFFDKNLK